MFLKIKDENGNWTSIAAIKGDNGEPGAPGTNGQDGADGTNGVSCTHEWNGTTLTITSASGTSSADLKGANGNPGKDGQDGKTPVKGTDYFTEADKQELVTAVIAALPSSEEVSY